MHSISKGAAVTALRAALLVGTAAIAVPAFAQTTTATPEPATQQAGPGGLEEIVVTAQKREENLQKVPVSVSVLSESTIRANRIENVRDLSAQAPNLVVRFSGGGGNIPNYTLRGIYTSGTALGTDKGVGLYIDGVYIQNVTGSVIDFADISRIEVLKGPQGTLFGRNATGGAISITTRDPSGVLGGYQELTYGNYAQFRSKTHIDLPKFGPFSAAVTYLHTQRHGDMKNSGAGTKLDYGPATSGVLGVITSPKYLGSDNTEAVTAAVKADLHPDLDLVYKFDWAQDHYTPNGSGNAYISGPSSIIGQLYASSVNPRTPITNKRPDTVNNSFTGPAYNTSMGHNLTAKFHLNDTISFKNILSYRKAFIRSFYQLDGLGGLTNQLVSLASLGLPVSVPVGTLNATPALRSVTLGAPFDFLANTTREQSHQWSDEFQMNITTQWFNVTAGYLHFHSYQQTEGYAGSVNVPTITAYSGQRTSVNGTAGVAPGNPGYQNASVSVNSDAWFVQPEIHLTDQIDVVGGARITIDRKDGIEPYPIPGAGPTNVIHYRDRGEATYLAGVNYKPTNNILIYAKYADGYISGGELATLAFKPERAFSYEAGAKTEFWNHRIRSNLAVFHVNYKDIQYNTAGVLTGVASSAAFGQAVVDAGDARANGFEWENTIAPIRGIVLTGNLGYTDFKFKQSTLNPGFIFASGAPGYKLQARPKWTGQLSASYESEPMFNGGHLLARVDANFKSHELLTSDIAPGNGPTAVEDPGITRAASVPFTWIVNGRLALTDIDVGPTKVEVAVWTKNMFNNRSMTQFIGVDFGALGFVGGAIYQPARTFGIDAGVKF